MTTTPSNYLQRLRAEREQRLRQERLAKQLSERLRQQREQESQRQRRQETSRAQVRESWLSGQRSEEQRQARREQRRHMVLARLEGERCQQRREETLHSQRLQELRGALLEEQRRQAREARHAEAPAAEPRDWAPEPRTPRREGLRKPPLPKPQLQARLALLREAQQRQRQTEGVERRRQEQLRATRLKELRRQQVAAGAASARAQASREKELGRHEQPQRPSPEQQRPSALVFAARPSARPPRPAARTSTVPPRAVEAEVGELSWLSTQGNFLVDENGHAVYLRGVNVVGFDTVNLGSSQTLADALALDDANLSALTDGWGVNLIRVPFESGTILRGNASLSPSEVLAGLDDLIAAASGVGCYVLLALKPAAEGNNLLPTDDDYLCWRVLAIHYQDDPAILYELFASTSVLADNWLGVAAAAIGTVRREHTASLLFMGNGQASTDVSGLPMRFATGDPIHNMAYAVRVTPQLLTAVDQPRLQALANSYPVFATEWLDHGLDGERPADLAANLFERYGIGWAASNWNQQPRLVANAATHDFSATRWGLVVQRALAQPVKPLLTPFG